MRYNAHKYKADVSQLFQSNDWRPAVAVSYGQLGGRTAYHSLSPFHASNVFFYSPTLRGWNCV